MSTPKSRCFIATYREGTVDAEGRLQFAISQHAKRKQACLFCRSRTHNRAGFIPRDQASWGAAPGHYRVFVFPVCKGCSEKSGDARELALVAWWRDEGREDMKEISLNTHVRLANPPPQT